MEFKDLLSLNRFLQDCIVYIEAGPWTLVFPQKHTWQQELISSKGKTFQFVCFRAEALVFSYGRFFNYGRFF